MVTWATQGALAKEGYTMASYALGAAAGSAASQVVAIGLGVQDKFSWSQVAIAAVGGAVTGGIQEAFVGTPGTFMTNAAGEIGTTGRAVSSVASGFAQAAASKMVTGQSNFSWANIAASAASSAMGGRLQGETSTTGLNFGEQFVMGVAGSAVGYGVNRALGGDRSWSNESVLSDAFGNAIGNSIVGGLQKSAAEKRQEELNKYAAMSAKLGADASRKVNSSLNFDVALPNVNNNQQYQNVLAGLTPKEVALRDTTRDVSGINALTAKYSADIAAKKLHGQQTTHRVDQLVAETQHLLGNTTEVTLRNSDGIYGVPELLKRPSNVTTPEQESFLSQVNSSWNKFEKDHPFLSEVLGKSAIIGTGMGIGRDIYSSFPKSSQSLMYGFGNTPKGYGFTGFTNKGYGQLYNLNSGNYISEVKPSLSTNVKLAQLSGSLNSGAKTGGFWGAGFAVAGRTLDYGLDPNKNIISSDFANDVKWDVAKGSVAGIAGGYAGAATTAAVTGLAMSSMAAGATIGTTIPIVGTLIGAGVGFAVGWGISYLIEDGVYKPLGFRD